MGARDELTGRTLGEFVLHERIGEGGFGAVYRCEQPLLGREAVVKVLHHNLRASEVVLQRFLREARLASRLDHPYAAHVYAFGVEKADGLLWIAMEMVHGTTLDRWLRDRGPLALDQFVPFFERIAEVVHTAHERGIVHRDLKPPNVMVIERAGRLLPKLLDFGIAKLVEGSPLPASTPPARETPSGMALDDTAALPPALKPSEIATLPGGADSPAGANGQAALTQEGAALGSPPYMAPEQWGDHASVGAPADLYALGVLAYETLAGRRPFVATTLAGYIDLHANASVPPLGVGPAALDAVFVRALAKKPQDRFANALELAAALRVASGLTEDSANLPRLDDAVRDAWLADAPQSLAETVAALDGARNAHQARDAAAELAHGIVRYLAVLALASRAQVRDDREDPQLAELLRACCRRDLDVDERARLIRGIVRPFASRRGAFPIPELVDLVASRADGNDALDRLLALQSSDGGGRVSDEQVRAQLAQTLPELGRLMRACAFVLDYPLVIMRDGGVERWTGLRRPRRALATVRDREPDDRRPSILDRDARVALDLWPLVQLLPPTTGADDEVFVFDGHGRHGARLVAAPAGFEYRDESVWDWLGERVLGEPPTTAPRDDDRAPYLGLASFRIEDADRFVGREREVDTFINRLRRVPLQIVVGASGAGKSSFVHAGVVPVLPAGWRTLSFRPGPSPIAALASALGASVKDDNAAIAEKLAASTRGGMSVVVVDQLEELFTQGAGEAERVRFVEILARLSHTSADPTRVICTVRDDFLMRLEALAPLRARLSPALFLLGNPGRDELIRCVVEPARRVGYELSDPELATEMVDAVAERPGALALLSFTASRLWELRDRRVRQLTRKAHDAMGGIGGALGRHAEDTLADLGADEQRLVREVFRHLVTADGTRAVLALEELRQILSSPRANAVIEKLVAARLIVVRDGESGGDVELVHEALIAAWPRLQQWIRDDVEGARTRDQLRAAARQWIERDRPKGLLWRDEVLADLERWRRGPGAHSALTTTELAFADASRSLAMRARRLRRGLAVAAFAALTVALVVLARLNSEANAQRARAETSATEAEGLARDTRRRLAEQSEEQGRLALLSGRSGLALVHLIAAIDQGAPRDAALDFMIGEAMKAFEGQRSVMRGHVGRILSLAPIGDTRVITTGDDGTARIWDLKTATQVAMIRGTTPLGEVRSQPMGERIATAGKDGVTRIHGLDGKLLFEARPELLDQGFLYPAFSRDGARLATVSGSNPTARIFDAKSGRLVLEMKLTTEYAQRISWSPDGRVVAVVGFGAELRDASTGALRARLVGHQSGITSVEFSPDGASVVTGSIDRTAMIWDAKTGQLRKPLEGHDGALHRVAFDPSGRYLVTASRDRIVRVWTTSDWRLHRAIEGHDAAVTAIALDARGGILATATEAGTIQLWDLAGGRSLRRFEGHGASVTGLAFVGTALVTTSADGTVRTWQLDPPEARVIAAPSTEVYSVDLSPDERQLIIGGGDGKVMLANRDGAAVAELAGHTAKVYDATFLAGGLIATASDDGTVRLWQGTEPLASFDVPATTRLASFAAHPDGSLVATGSSDGTVIIWRVNGTRQATISSGTASVSFLMFSHDGRLLVGTKPGPAYLYGLDGTKKATLAHEQPIQSAEFSANGDLLTGSGNVARIWDATGKQKLSLAGHVGRIWSTHLANGHAITAGADGELRLWRLTDGTHRAFEGHSNAVVDARWHPRGLLVSLGNDGTLRVWDPETGRLLESYVAHRRGVDDMRIARDGTIFTGGFDGSVVARSLTLVPLDLDHARKVRACVPLELVDGRFRPIVRAPGCP